MENMSFMEAKQEYEKAQKHGKKENTPMLVLDDILKEKNIAIPKEIPLGVVQIPMEQIVGTKTAGRSSAFSGNFYPILDSSSEFATKWANLYASHIKEGIREPIKAYEFMNQFYVEEGNKRVSVLKYCGAVSVPGNVIRIIPPRSEDKEVKIYYEFLEFYKLSKINYLWFSKPSGFARLQQLVGKRPDEMWTEEEVSDFRFFYNRFVYGFEDNGGKKLNLWHSDAFLSFLEIYDYSALKKMDGEEQKEKIHNYWEEFKLLTTEEAVELQMDPSDEKQIRKSIFARLLPQSATELNVVFVHEKTAQTSAWTYAHELGRMHLQETFGEQLHIKTYDNATQENIDEILRQAIEDGNTIIFTTSPPLLKGSVKAAVEHPEIKILNCSLDRASRSVRTYYARMYEAKFLMGAIAGAMAENGKIGYVADYPIRGMIANINAFALGAKMVNPRAKVYLEWSTVKGIDIKERMDKHQVSNVSGRDMIIPGATFRNFGIFSVGDETPVNLAAPMWNWGKFYEQMLRNIINDAWKNDDASDETKGLNYWWGMSSEIIDVFCSKHLPIGTTRLIHLLKETIQKGEFNPFSGILYSQNGIVQKDPDAVMAPEDIIDMDWLAENVIGRIPSIEELQESAMPVVQQQGIDNW